MRLKTGLRVGISGIALLLAGCGGHESERPARAQLDPVAVETAPVQASTDLRVQEVAGAVESELTAEVRAKVMGQVGEVLVQAGQRIEAGQTAIVLEAAELGARVARAEAEAKQAELELARVARLLESKAASPQDYDRAEAAHRATQAVLDELRTYAGYLTVTAPFGGVVSRVDVDPGDLASPGSPLFALYDDAQLVARVEVPESLAEGLVKGESFAMRIGTRADAIRGSVFERAPVSDPVRRTVSVKLLLPPGTGAQPGEFVRVDFPVAGKASLTVPRDAVFRRGQLEYVYVVDAGHARLRLVKTGRDYDRVVEVLSGLREGELVVVSDVAAVSDGQPIK